MYRKTNRLAEGFVLIQKCLQIINQMNLVLHSVMLEARCELGSIYFKMGEFTKAMFEFDQVLKNYSEDMPKFSEAHIRVLKGAARLAMKL